MDQPKIWVIANDYGYEGLGEPFAAFTDEGEAKSAFELLTKPLGASSYKLVEVPLWPLKPDTPASHAGEQSPEA